MLRAALLWAVSQAHPVLAHAIIQASPREVVLADSPASPLSICTLLCALGASFCGYHPLAPRVFFRIPQQDEHETLIVLSSQLYLWVPRVTHLSTALGSDWLWQTATDHSLASGHGWPSSLLQTWGFHAFSRMFTSLPRVLLAPCTLYPSIPSK